MRLSEDTRQKLYDAVSIPVMDLRVRLQMNEDVDVDLALFHLTEQVWRDIQSTLKISGSGGGS